VESRRGLSPRAATQDVGSLGISERPKAYAGTRSGAGE